jgi:predicted CopG family antitoxin
MATKNVNLRDETIARLKGLTREEMPSLSALVDRLLTRELDRLDAARERKSA